MFFSGHPTYYAKNANNVEHDENLHDIASMKEVPTMIIMISMILSFGLPPIFIGLTYEVHGI